MDELDVSAALAPEARTETDAAARGLALVRPANGPAEPGSST